MTSMSAYRRHGRPHWLAGLGAAALARPLTRMAFGATSRDGYDEAWLQGVLYDNPSLLPAGEVEPAFLDSQPVCRELGTPAGPLDLLYCNAEGLLTLVECKLWRNPEARREVVGQILDYARALSRWSYEELQQAIRRATGSTAANPLYEIARRGAEDLDEAGFIDAVVNNLRASRFLLLIVGDGIREGVEDIADYLQRHAGLHFTFALVEMAVFQLPDQGYLVEPRLLTRTREIERAVVRLEGANLVAEAPREPYTGKLQAARRIDLSDDLFYERLGSVDPALPAKVKAFLAACSERGLTIAQGANTRLITWEHDTVGRIRFASITQTGTAMTDYIAQRTADAGDISIGEEYLEGVARLLPQGEVIKTGKPSAWYAAVNRKIPPVAPLLDRAGEWLALIERAIEQLEALKTRQSA